MAKEKKNGNGLGGLVVGSIIGAAAGVLLAPKSGKETRKDIKNKAEEIRDKGQEAIDTAKQKVEEIVPQLGAANLENLKASFEDKLAEVSEKIDAIDNANNKKSLNKLRDNLEQKANELKDTSEDKLEDLRAQFEEIYANIQEKLSVSRS